jgi:hypothetical protein
MRSLDAEELLVIKSKYLKTTDSFLVFKPSKYAAQKQHPLFYLLYGHSANFRIWIVSLWLFIQQSNYFKSAGSTSGVVNLTHSAFKNTTLASHVGKYSTGNKNFDKFSIVNNVKRLAIISKPWYKMINQILIL